MISSQFSSPTWDDASSPAAVQLAREFEARWRSSHHGPRPELSEFLARDGQDGGPGWILALLRTDLSLRREAGEDVRIESYYDRYPDLPGEVLVALAYEDFCLREEAGEHPDPTTYYEHLPTLAGQLREIFAIHALIRVSVAPSTRPHQSLPSAAFFADSCQTIGGFFLVEELGRGSFARVFLARERQLADRLVALKVSMTGSREPQALARLQHTNIVPVHSYRVDPATGLHLLCMPYFGRVTLARLLEDQNLPTARSGAALVTALDRLIIPADEPMPGQPTGEAGRDARRSLSSRSYSQAVALWGAQLADALRHAHDRSVLHRDLKPSNILLAADATPMILDFNLARETDAPAAEGAYPGGTLAYMAPEHLEALIEGHDRGVDHRADIYALGLILHEMLGSKPLDGSSRTISPQRLLGRRREGPPAALGRSRSISGRLAAVLRRCLLANPAERYASAGDLALDLWAISDDDPLAFAYEPWPSRTQRWFRHNKVTLVAWSLVILILLGCVAAWLQRQFTAHTHQIGAVKSLQAGDDLTSMNESRAAAVQYARALDWTAGFPELATLRQEAGVRQRSAESASAARDQVDPFFERAAQLQFAVLGFGGDPASGGRTLAEALLPLGVLSEPEWPRSALLVALDRDRRSRLLREVDALLYLWVVAAARHPGATVEDSIARNNRIQTAVTYCDKALTFSTTPAPWIALRRWWQDQARSIPPAPDLPSLSLQDSAPACFRWYLLGTLGADRATALKWLEAAVRLEPQNYWHQFILGYEQAGDGRSTSARAHYDVAIALRPDLPWAWKNRAILVSRLGEWSQALHDLDRGLAVCPTREDQARIQIERARTNQRLGAFPAARADYAVVEAIDPTHQLARQARCDRARLEADAGATMLARNLYGSLIATHPDDWPARLGRANLALRQGQLDAARSDLDDLITHNSRPFQAEALRDRAMLGLAQGRLDDALADVQRSLVAQKSRLATRLLDRIQLARNIDPDEWPASPDAFDALPRGGPELDFALLRAAARLQARIEHAPSPATWRRPLAVILAAAHDHTSARTVADQIIAEAPRSAESWLLRARIARRANRLTDALADLAEGLRRDPEHAHLIELRGLIQVERNEPTTGSADLLTAYHRGAASARGPTLARALGELGRVHEAITLWIDLIAADPTDGQLYLGLANTYRRQHEWDRTLANLETAAGVIEPRSPLLGRLTLSYMACLPARPDRLPRVLTLGRSWLHTRWRE